MKNEWGNRDLCVRCPILGAAWRVPPLLRRVAKVADVHVSSWTGTGRASPTRVICAPHVKQEGSRCAGHGRRVRDHHCAVNVPVDVGRGPDNFEVMVVPLVVSRDLGVLKVGETMPISAVHRVGYVADLLHVDFGVRVAGVEKARGI